MTEVDIISNRKQSVHRYQLPVTKDESDQNVTNSRWHSTEMSLKEMEKIIIKWNEDIEVMVARVRA